MTRAATKVAAIALLTIASVLAVPATAGAAAPTAAPGPFTLTMPDGGGQLHIAGSENDQPLGTPTTISGTVDATTGEISAGSFATPTISFQQDITSPITATVYIDASFSEVTPNSATGSIDSDGNVLIQDAMAVSLHIEVGSPPAITADCRSKPVNLTFQSTAPYDPDTNTVTLTDSDFTVPPVIDEDACNSLVQGAINDQLAGSGNSLTMTLNGELPIPEPPGEASTTTLAVTPAGGARLGKPVTMTAMVANGDSGTTPTGFVDFLDGTTKLATEPVTGGSATYTTSSLTPGDHHIVAKYRGDSTYAPSTSSPVTYSVAAAPTVTADLPAYVESGGAAKPFDLTISNPDVGAAIDNARADVTIEGGFGSVGPTNVTLERQKDDGTWVAVPLTAPSNGTVVGSIGVATGSPLAVGSKLTSHLRVSTTADPGELQVSVEALSVDPTDGSPAPAPAPADDALASTSAALTIVPPGRVDPGLGFSPFPFLPAVSPPVVRQGYSIYLGPIFNSKIYGDPTGTFRAVVDGVPVPVRNNATPPEDGFANTVGMGLFEAYIPRTMTTGAHDVTVKYSGDSTYLPAQATTQIQVLPATGTPYLCTNSTGNFLFGANVVAQANLPGAAAPGATVDLGHLDVTVLTGRSNQNLNGFGSDLDPGWNEVGGGELTGVGFAFGPNGAGTASAAKSTASQMNTPDPDNPDGMMEFRGETGAITVDGAPGEAVPATLGDVSFSYLSFGFEATATCTPVDEPVTLGTVTVAGTTLAVTSADDPTVAGSDVTMTAAVAPTNAGGSVFFKDGDSTVGVAPVASDGTATLTTSALGAGDHHLTAVWSGNLSLPSTTSDPVDLTVYPDVACPTDAVSGSTATVRWVYLSLLNRCPDPGGLAYWTGRIDSGDSPASVAHALTQSTESVNRVVDGAYEQVLGRPADQGGLAYWSSRIASGSLSYQGLLAHLAGSAEFYRAAGSDTAFVNAAYQVILGRPADSGGLDYWVGQLASGHSPRWVAHALAFSTESATRIVTDVSARLLGTPLTGSDLTDAVDGLQADGSVPNLQARIIASADFTAYAQTFPDLPGAGGVV